MPLFANKARSALAAGSSIAGTGTGLTVNVTAGSGVLFTDPDGRTPSALLPMRGVLTAVDANGNDTGVEEIIEFSRSGDVLTLTARGLEHTTPAVWPAGTILECRPSAKLAQRVIVLARGVGGSTVSQLNFESGPYPQPNSLMPNQTPLVIPAGTLVAGDIIRAKFRLGHRGGASQSTSWTVMPVFNNYFGGLQLTMNNKTAAANYDFLVIDPAALQTMMGHFGSGGFYGDFDSTYTFNMNTTPIPFDIEAKFNAAPVAGETLYLDHYEFQLLPAGMP